MTPDTAALRVDIERANAREDVYIEVETATLDALCDAADEVERLRNPAQGDRVTFQHRIERLLRVALGYRAERDASRTAHADALALLRAVVSYDDANQSDLPLPLLTSIRAAIGGRS